MDKPLTKRRLKSLQFKARISANDARDSRFYGGFKLTVENVASTVDKDHGLRICRASGAGNEIDRGKGRGGKPLPVKECVPRAFQCGTYTANYAPATHIKRGERVHENHVHNVANAVRMGRETARARAVYNRDFNALRAW